ncbi:MAG: type III pantothenate kinase [Candidatus Kapaibacteriales bacterium]
MTKIADIGNSRIKIYEFKSIGNYNVDYYPISDFNKIDHKLEDCYLYSTNNKIIVNRDSSIIINAEFIDKLIGIEYKHIQGIGIDRILNAAYVNSLSKKNHKCIIDFGTATTTTFLESNKVLGGTISLGIDKSLSAIEDINSILTPKAPEPNSNNSTIGQNTNEAVYQGTFSILAHGLKATIFNVFDKNDSDIFVTGGKAETLLPILRATGLSNLNIVKDLTAKSLYMLIQ